LGRVCLVAASSADARASAATVGRRKRTDHWARDCRQPRKERVNLTQAEDDDEPALLMAMVEESHDVVEPAPPQVVEPALEQQQLVHLDETKA
jgi:hypothetical protein